MNVKRYLRIVQYGAYFCLPLRRMADVKVVHIYIKYTNNHMLHIGIRNKIVYKINSKIIVSISCYSFHEHT